MNETYQSSPGHTRMEMYIPDVPEAHPVTVCVSDVSLLHMCCYKANHTTDVTLHNHELLLIFFC
jgi:hypothetical protein